MKNKSFLMGIAIWGTTLAVVIAGLFIWCQSSNVAGQQAIADTYAASSSTPSDFIPFSNQQFGFSLSYPPDLVPTQTQEPGGAYTFSFQDPDTNEGFEIYVTPYPDTKVTEQRFKLDEPSGVMDQPTAVVIGGVTATMFFGHNDILGDTREVWFTHDSYLYEVTTFKELDSWLGQIMQTWKFL